MKSIIPLMAVFLVCVGCDKKVESVSSVETPSSDSSPSPTARPIVIEPEVDKTFMDSTAVESWRADIAAAIEEDATIQHPREIWKYVSDFHVDRSKPDPLLGDPSIWDAIQVEEPATDDHVATDILPPRADEALALEAEDREWDAAQLWIELNRLDDAVRCGAELEEEGEWKAVAMIAVHTGDLEALDRATTHLMADDQVSRTQDVVSYAFDQSKIDIARQIASRYEWTILKILDAGEIRELALKGDTSLLIEMLDREIVAWESGKLWSLDEYQPPVAIVVDIAILGQTDKVKAREYAGRYLKLNTANVFLWTECGEGCYSEPIRGSLELYSVHTKKQDSFQEWNTGMLWC